MGFSRQEYWNRWPFPFPGDHPESRIKPTSPALAGEFFTTEPPGSLNIKVQVSFWNLVSILQQSESAICVFFGFPSHWGHQRALNRIRCGIRTFSLLIYFISSIQSLSCVWLFAIPWAVAHQGSLSITNSQGCSNSSIVYILSIVCIYTYIHIYLSISISDSCHSPLSPFAIHMLILYICVSIPAL